MRKLRLCLSQRLLGLLRAHHRSDIGAGAAITEKTTIDVEERLSAGSNVYLGAAFVDDAIDEIPKRSVGIKCLPMRTPFVWFGLEIGRGLPSEHARITGRHKAGNIDVFRDAYNSVIRPSLPKPVRSCLGIISKALLTLP